MATGFASGPKARTGRHFSRILYRTLPIPRRGASRPATDRQARPISTGSPGGPSRKRPINAPPCRARRIRNGHDAAYIPVIQGCPGPIGYGDDDGAPHGRPRFIRGLVIPGGDDAKRPKAAFQEAMNDDPAHCETGDRKPDRPQKGSVNVPPGRGLHHCARRQAPEGGPTQSSAMRSGAGPNTACPRLPINGPQLAWAGRSG